MQSIDGLGKTLIHHIGSLGGSPVQHIDDWG